MFYKGPGISTKVRDLSRWASLFSSARLLKSANFVAGTLLMFCGGLIMTGTLALLPTMLQNLMNYPALTTGLVTAPRGIGSMAATFQRRVRS